MKRFFSICLLSLVLDVAPGLAQTVRPLMLIDGNAIGVTEYEIFRQLCHTLETERTELLNEFIDFKLKALEALQMGCDTLASFQKMLKALSVEETCNPHRKHYNGNSIQKGGWVKMEMLTVPVRQDATNALLERRREELQNVYRELQEKQYLKLSDMAKGRQYHNGENWVPVDWLLPEEEEAVRKTAVGEYSGVFVSSVGVNLLRVLDRTDDDWMTEKRGATVDYPLKDILLAMYWDYILYPPLTNDNIDEHLLAAFYRKNHKRYTFDLPHYKGVVVHCSEKRDQKVIKRKLKKVSYDKWPEETERLMRHNEIGETMVEYGLFRIGSNETVDCLAFKCIDLPEDPQYPYTFVKGKILKYAPETYEDIRSKVIADYLQESEQIRLDALKRRHVVEFVDKVSPM